jgi:hypothetical protein
MQTAIRINMTVSKQLLHEVEKAVTKRGKSSFITEAIAEKLARDKRERALEELAALPPTFTAIADGATFIAEQRRTDEGERMQKLM